MAASTPIPTPSAEPPDAFRPDEAQLPSLLDALCSPSLSVQQIAAQFSTSIDALCLYITSPRGDDSLATLATLDSALTIRLRLVALSALPAAVASLSAIVQDHARQERDRHKDCDAAPVTIDDIKLQEGKRVNARKASALLFRLATLHPRTHRRTPRTPFSDPVSPSSASTTHASSAAHSPRAATGSTTPSDPVAASSNCTTPCAASTAERLDPLDPLDRIDSLSDFSIPRELRAQTPRTASDFSGAYHDHFRPCEGDRGSASHFLRSIATISSTPATLGQRQPIDSSPPLGQLIVGFATTAARSLVALVGSTTPITISAPHASIPPDSSNMPSARPSSTTVPSSTTAAQSDRASSPCSPTGFSPVAGGEAAPRGADPRKAAPNHRTLKGSALHTNAPASLPSGP